MADQLNDVQTLAQARRRLRSIALRDIRRAKHIIRALADKEKRDNPQYLEKIGRKYLYDHMHDDKITGVSQSVANLYRMKP